MTFLATINVPGYLPTDDDPPVFDTATEAWDYLARERREDEDDNDDIVGGYSATVNVLECLAQGDWENFGADVLAGTGTVFGPTPGHTGDHDLGVAYSVTEVRP